MGPLAGRTVVVVHTTPASTQLPHCGCLSHLNFLRRHSSHADPGRCLELVEVVEVFFSSDMRAVIGIRKLMVHVSIIPMGRKYLEVLLNWYSYPVVRQKCLVQLLWNELQQEKDLRWKHLSFGVSLPCNTKLKSTIKDVDISRHIHILKSSLQASQAVKGTCMASLQIGIVK